MFHLFLLLVLSLIIRARTCPLYLAALLFRFREPSLPILSLATDFFPILGHIRSDTHWDSSAADTVRS